MSRTTSPNFALSLSFEGVRLLHRADRGWSLVGAVSPDSDDLAADLAALRAKALTLDPGGLRTRLILPNDQIRYLSLDGDADADAVRAALDGATPYALDDLVIDHVAAGGKTHVAAVARETLVEAEAFAVEHKFAPVVFAAAPAADTYSGEAFFGLTKVAPSLLGKDVTVSREAHPVLELPVKTDADVGSPAKPVPSEDVATLQAESTAAEKPDPTPKKSVAAPAADTSTSAPPTKAEPKSEPIGASPSAEPKVVAAPKSPLPAAPHAAASAPASASLADKTDVVGDITKTEVVAKLRSETTIPATASADAAVAPAFASRLRAQVEGRSAREMSSAPAEAVEVPAPPSAPKTGGADATHAKGSQPGGPTTASILPTTGTRGFAPSSTGSPAAAAAPPIMPRNEAPRPDGGPRTVSATNTPAFTARPDAGPQPVPPRIIPGTPPPAVAERLAAIARRDLAKPRNDSPAPVSPLPPAAGQVAPKSGVPARPVPAPVPAPMSAPMSAPAGGDAAGDAAPPGKVLIKPTAAPPSPKDLGATLRQDAALTETGPVSAAKARGGLGGLFSSRRTTDVRTEPAPSRIGAPTTLSTASTAPVLGQSARGTVPSVAAAKSRMSAPRSERDSMTVFGAREKAAATPTRTKPRFMLLLLVVILLLAMAAVAAWATVFPDSRVAEWLGLGGESDTAAIAAAPVPENVAEPEPPAAVAAPIPQTEVAPTDVAPVVPQEATALVAPAVEALPEVPGGDSAAAVATAPALPAPLPPETELAAQSDPDPPAPAVEPEPEPEPVPAEVAVGAPSPATGLIPTPAEADRFYAATGVWLRAPRLPLRPEPEILAGVSVSVLPTPRTPLPTAPALTVLAPDGPIATQFDPPAADETFPRDERGFLLATADGIVTPDGMAIFAGPPPMVPPTRPGTTPVAAEPEVVPDVPADVQPQALPDAPTDDPDTAGPAAASFPNALETSPGRPLLRPASFADLFGPLPPESIVDPDVPASADSPAISDTATDPTVDPTADEAPAALPGGVSLAGLRPAQRPQGLAPEADAVPEGAEPEDLVAFAGPRPPERPAGLAPATQAVEGPNAVDAAIEDAVADGVADDVHEPEPAIENTLSSALAAIVAAGPDPLASATRLAVARAQRPDARPRNFAQVVASTRTRTQTAAAAPAAAPTTAAAVAPTANAGGIPRSAEDDGEPEPASGAAAAPTGPTTTTVAAAATQQSVIDLGRVNLIGVYGRPNNRSALIRLANGRYVRVGVGDSLEGGQVTAIGDNALNYVVRGQLYALVIPEE